MHHYPHLRVGKARNDGDPLVGDEGGGGRGRRKGRPGGGVRAVPFSILRLLKQELAANSNTHVVAKFKEWVGKMQWYVDSP